MTAATIVLVLLFNRRAWLLAAMAVAGGVWYEALLALAHRPRPTVDQVLQGVLNINPTVQISVAPARADVVQDAAAGTTTSTAHAQGVRVDLLPLGDTGNISDRLGEPRPSLNGDSHC